MLPQENANLNKIKLKALINFKFKAQFFYFIVYKLYSFIYAKLRDVQYRFIKT